MEEPPINIAKEGAARVLAAILGVPVEVVTAEQRERNCQRQRVMAAAEDLDAEELRVLADHAERLAAKPHPRRRPQFEDRLLDEHVAPGAVALGGGSR